MLVQVVVCLGQQDPRVEGARHLTKAQRKRQVAVMVSLDVCVCFCVCLSLCAVKRGLARCEFLLRKVLGILLLLLLLRH